MVFVRDHRQRNVISAILVGRARRGRKVPQGARLDGFVPRPGAEAISDECRAPRGRQLGLLNES
jgi:hypothetical protein